MRKFLISILFIFIILLTCIAPSFAIFKLNYSNEYVTSGELTKESLFKDELEFNFLDIPITKINTFSIGITSTSSTADSTKFMYMRLCLYPNISVCGIKSTNTQLVIYYINTDLYDRVRSRTYTYGDTDSDYSTFADFFDFGSYEGSKPYFWNMTSSPSFTYISDSDFSKLKEFLLATTDYSSHLGESSKISSNDVFLSNPNFDLYTTFSPAPRQYNVKFNYMYYQSDLNEHIPKFNKCIVKSNYNLTLYIDNCFQIEGEYNQAADVYDFSMTNLSGGYGNVTNRIETRVVHYYCIYNITDYFVFDRVPDYYNYPLFIEIDSITDYSSFNSYVNYFNDINNAHASQKISDEYFNYLRQSYLYYAQDTFTTSQLREFNNFYIKNIDPYLPYNDIYLDNTNYSELISNNAANYFQNDGIFARIFTLPIVWVMLFITIDFAFLGLILKGVH